MLTTDRAWARLAAGTLCAAVLFGSAAYYANTAQCLSLRTRDNAATVDPAEWKRPGETARLLRWNLRRFNRVDPEAGVEFAFREGRLIETPTVPDPTQFYPHLLAQAALRFVPAKALAQLVGAPDPFATPALFLEKRERRLDAR